MKMNDLENKVANFKGLEKKGNKFEISMEEQRKTMKNAEEGITGLLAKIHHTCTFCETISNRKNRIYSSHEETFF